MNAETTPTADGIARRIRLQVERFNLTVRSAAQACDMPVPSFETYLYGRNMPGALALVALAEGLRCPVGWLLTGEFSK